MRAIKQVLRQDKEPYRVPRRVQDVIPIKRIWSDGIFLVGNRYAKTFKFTDINYMVASKSAKKKMFLNYAALINSLDCGATTKITVNNRHLNRKNFESDVLFKMEGDSLDCYRGEYNGVILDKATGGNDYLITGAIGFVSSVVDNVPLVAGAIKMYVIDPASANLAVDGIFWQLLAYCAGVGGSLLIIGSAAGVVAMGLEKIDFAWYFRRITLLALLGYVAGVVVIFVEHILVGIG